MLQGGGGGTGETLGLGSYCNWGTGSRWGSQQAWAGEYKVLGGASEGLMSAGSTVQEWRLWVWEGSRNGN